MTTIIAKNNTVSDVLVADLGVTIPGSGQLTLTGSFSQAEINSSVDLLALVNDGPPPAAGTLTINDGTSDLPPGDGVLEAASSAIHSNAPGEITAISEKVTPVSADVLIGEDSASNDDKVKIQIGNLPAGAPAAHASTHESGGSDQVSHDQLTDYAIGEHRVINDSGSSTTELWSASKISGDISAVAAGVDIKAGVDTTTYGLGNIALTGEQTLNGLLTSASRVLVVAQTLPAQNGIYVTAAGPWARAADADTDAEVTNGNIVHVLNSGSSEYKNKYILVTPDPITVGSTAQSWERHRDIDFGTTSGTATEGNDTRVPSQDENDALAGTDGTPSSSNKYVTNSDSRNTDARTPTSHASTHDAGGGDAMAIDAAAGTGSLRTLGTGATNACAGDDSRLSDARTPTSHASTHENGGGDEISVAGLSGLLADDQNPVNHASDHDAGGSDAMAIDAAAGTGSLRTLGTGATNACAGNDARLSDARTPTSHASSHETGGSDVIAPDASQVNVPVIGTPTVDKLDEFISVTISAGANGDSFITDAGGGTIDVAAGDGIIKATDAHDGVTTYFEWSASSGIAIPSNTIRYVGVEYNAGSPQVVVKTSDTWDGHTDFRLGSVVNEAGTLHILNNPQVCADIGQHAYHRVFETLPLQRADRLGGLIVGETGTRNITLSAGELYDGFNEFSISAIDTSAADTFDAYYQDGGGGWTKQSAQTQYNNTQYDDGDGTLGTLTNNRYGLHWVYLEADGSLVLLYGRGDYTSVVAAQAEAAPSNVPDRVAEHGKLVGRIIFQKSAASASAIESAFDTAFAASQAQDHNNDLSGLQGGQASEYYHLTSAEYSALGTPNAHASTHDAGGADAMAIDAAAGTGSLRTLGTGATNACAGNDSRLSDARTPTSHASSHDAGGGDAMAIDAAAGTGSLRTLGTGATNACAGNDSRLSDARTPTSHASSHDAGGGDAMAIDAAAGTGSLRTLGTGATNACAGNDSRLSDARTPTSHASSHDAGGGDAMAIDAVAGTGSLRTLGTGATNACAGNDARLSDARTPTSHASSHDAGGGDAMAIDAAAGTGSLRTLGTGATNACAGNDARLSDARTPTSHASSHDAGGGDAMAIDAAAGTGSLRTLGTGATNACAGNDSRLSDARTPTNHASNHTDGTDDVAVMVGANGGAGTKGLVPAPGAGDAAAGKYLKADGTWAVPPGGGGDTVPGQWEFDTGTSDADPGAGKFRFNNGTQSSATFIYVNDSTENGADLSAALLALASTDRILLQTGATKANFHVVQVTGAPTDATTYVKIPISVTDSGTDLGSAEDVVFHILKIAGGGGIDGTLTAARVPFALDSDTLEDEAGFTYTKGTDTLAVPALIVNESAAANDQRMEGPSMSHMFFLHGDTSTENVVLLAASEPGFNSMDRGMFVGNATTAPTGNPTSGIYFYVESGQLKVRDPNGVVTELTPS